MKHGYLAFLFLLAGCAHTTPGEAVAPQAASPSELETKGQVEAVIVVGDVQLIATDGTARALNRRDTFEEGNKIVANKDSNALLVFSNGATLHITADTEVELVKYRQAPFDEQANGTFLRLTKDPSRSNIELKLTKGRLQVEVKKLNTAEGSTFDLTTLMGPIHLREGGVFSVTATDQSLNMERVVRSMQFTPTVTTTTTNANGTSTTVTNANINTAATITVNLSVDPTTGQITGGSMEGTNLRTTASRDLANALNDTVNTALAEAGLPAPPPPSIPPGPASASVPGTGNKPGQTMATVTVDRSIGGGNVSISWDEKISQAAFQKLANTFIDAMQRSGQSITRISEGYNGTSGQGSVTISWTGELLPATVQALTDALNEAAKAAQAASAPTATANVEPPPWPPGVPELKGQVQALIVVGDVQLVGPDGTATPLKRGETFQEGSKVVANKGANALLVFSNGTTIHVKAGTEMAVAMFRQAPYDQAAEGTFLRLTKDPSRSNVVLKVSGGMPQGEVKKLNVEAGSTFEVDTPTQVIHLRPGELLDGTPKGGAVRSGPVTEQDNFVVDTATNLAVDSGTGLIWAPP